VPELRRLLHRCHSNCLLVVLKWCGASLKGRSEVNVSWDDSSREQAEHAVVDIVLCDRRWFCEWVISEILREDSLREEDLVGPPCSDSKLL